MGGMAQSFVSFRYECYFKMHFSRGYPSSMRFEEERILSKGIKIARGGEKRRGEENKSRSNSKAVRNYRGPSRRSREGNDETVGERKGAENGTRHLLPINNRYYIVHYRTEKARRQEQTFSQLRGGETEAQQPGVLWRKESLLLSLSARWNEGWNVVGQRPWNTSDDCRSQTLPPTESLRLGQQFPIFFQFFSQPFLCLAPSLILRSHQGNLNVFHYLNYLNKRVSTVGRL